MNTTVPRVLLACCACAVWAASPARAQLEPQPKPDDEQKPAAPPPPPALENPPTLAAGADPIYPESARAVGRGGDVVLRIVIDDAGGVARVDVVQSASLDPEDEIGRELDWAALGAATNFVFTPATFCFTDVAEDGAQSKRCGVPGAVALDYKTTFALEEKVVEVPVEAPEETAAAGGVLNLEGIVREAGNKDPLEGVEVTIDVPKPNAKDLPVEEAYETLTATTGEDGRFEMRGVPPGNWRIDFTYSGYEPSFVEEEISDNEKTSLVIYLTPRETNRFETVIRRRRAVKDVAKVSLSRDEVKRVPGTFGDPLRVIENLPGLARAPFFGGALIVRGANPADSGVYFDGVEIPILYHFGGLTSVVNAEFLEDIAFYPGGFGAKYGRATAGIVDVTSRELKFKNYRGYAEVDLLDAGFFFAGPVKVGELPTVTFAAAARRSYIDAILPLVLDAFIGPSGQGIVAAPVYWDYQAKLETRPFEGQTFSLFLFGSQDDLRVVSTGVDQSLDVGFRQTFHRLVGKWDWKINSRLQHTLQPYIGVTRFEFQAGSEGDQGPDVSASGIIDTYNWGVRDQLTYSLSDRVTLRGGVDYLGQTFGVEFDLPLPLEIGSFPRQYPRLEGINQTIGQSGFNNATGLWVEAEIDALPRLKIIPGARAELTVVTFLPDEGIDGSTTKSNDVSLFHVDPRITARYELIPQTTVKAAAGVYRQPPDPQQLSDDVGNPELIEPRAVQLIAGIEQGLTDNINLDVQLYVTNRDLLVQSTDDVRSADDGSGNADPLLFNNGGRGRTFGAEVLLRHELTQYLYGWVAYTLSRTVIDLDENDSSYLLTDFDQTHILTVVAQTNLPYGFTLGARFRAVTGNPTSLPIGSVHDVDTMNYLSLGSAPQSARLPAFHQLDIRVDRKFVFETFSLTAYLDLLNAYYAKNAEGYQSDFRSRELQPIPSLPILPVIGMSGEF